MSRKSARRLAFEPLEGRALLSTASARPLVPASEVTTADAPYRVVRTRSDVTYTADGSKLDVLTPEGAPAPQGGFPAIIALPGGGWRPANREDYGGAVATSFGPYGYVVVPTDVAYAGRHGGTVWPRNVEDVRDAVRWVRTHAGLLGVNPDKVVVSGESAGAHLALLAGTLDPGGFDPGSGHRHDVDAKAVSGKPNAVVSFYAPTDLAAEWDQRPSVRPYLLTYLGGPLKAMPGRYAAASPMDHVSPDDPPTYLTQGTADKVIILSTTLAFDQALKDAGVKEELTIIPGAPHGYRFLEGGIPLAEQVREFLAGVWASRSDGGS